MTDAVFEAEETATFSPFAALCCVEEMVPSAVVFPWGEVKGNNLTFFAASGEEESVFLDNAFGQVTVTAMALFVFVWGEESVSRPFSSF